MSGGDGVDLSGAWTGIYNYPSSLPPNAFEAVLRESAGSIMGTMAERDDDPHGVATPLHSVVEGRRAGSLVTFAKMYEDADRMPDAVFYSGTIEPDANEISGRWDIPGHWSGTFLMVRAGSAAEYRAQVADEKIPI